MENQTQHFALGFGSQASKIIREYANGTADGFLNDLADGHLGNPASENELVAAFIQYVAKQ